MAVFELSKQIYSAMNNRKLFGSICLDLSKAFDCIDHVKLFNKLSSCGISNSVITWFRSYFDRTQEVIIGDKKSICRTVSTGIGQGTILGPLIFIFYINDVIKNVSDLRINMYADNCLISTIGNNWERMVIKLQEGLDSFQRWFIKNGMKLNIKKSKSLVIGTPHKLSNIDTDNRFILNNKALENVQSYNYLGIILDSNMALSPLFSKVKDRVRRSQCDFR